MNVIQILEQLPPSAQKEVVDFASFLASKYVNKKDGKSKRKKFSYSWQNKLKNKLSSVELQHKANTWR